MAIKTVNKAAKSIKSSKTIKLGQGQSAAPLDLSIDDLNANERTVLTAITTLGTATLGELAAVSFPRNPKANSWTRNSLRRLVRSGFVDPIAAGFYQLGSAAVDMEIAA